MFEKIKKYFGFGAQKLLTKNDSSKGDSICSQPFNTAPGYDAQKSLLKKSQSPSPSIHIGLDRLKKQNRGSTPYKMKFLDKRKKMIVKNIEDGVPYGQIAKKYNVCIATFDKWRAQNNLKK